MITEVFKLLAEAVGSIDVLGKELYRTYGDNVVSTGMRECMEGLQPYSHWDADNRIFLPVLQTAKKHDCIMIRTIDTDVFVFALTDATSTRE